MLACGIGSRAALMGVIVAVPFVLKGSSDALRLVSSGFVPYANILGLLALFLLCFWLYRTTVRKK